MTPEAEILLLILAANGGTMDRPDAERELHRVLRLSPDERAAWRRTVAPLVQPPDAATIAILGRLLDYGEVES